MKRALGTILIALFCVLWCVPVSATTIEFTVTEFINNRWQYEYFLSEGAFAQDQGFTILFDNLLYSDLTLEGPLPQPPPPGDWDALVIQPELPPPLGLGSAGFYDALAVVPDPTLAGPFLVSFLWSGVGAPGAQPFEIYQLEQDQFGQEILRTTETGQTTPVPEPSTLFLVAAGAGLARVLRKRSRGSPVEGD